MKPIKRPQKYVRVDDKTFLLVDATADNETVIRKFKERMEHNRESLKNPPKKSIDFFR